MGESPREHHISTEQLYTGGGWDPVQAKRRADPNLLLIPEDRRREGIGEQRDEICEGAVEGMRGVRDVMGPFPGVWGVLQAMCPAVVRFSRPAEPQAAGQEDKNAA